MGVDIGSMSSSTIPRRCCRSRVMDGIRTAGSPEGGGARSRRSILTGSMSLTGRWSSDSRTRVREVEVDGIGVEGIGMELKGKEGKGSGKGEDRSGIGS